MLSKKQVSFLCDLLAGFFLCGLIGCGKSPESVLQDIGAEFQQKYQVSLEYKAMPETTWKLDYHLAPETEYPELSGYMKMVEAEFEKYPATFVAKTRLQKIVVVRDLAYGGQLRTAVPDYGKNVLILDFHRGNYDKVYQRHVFHHEYYHLIESALNGNAYWKDPSWIALQPQYFYGQGGARVQSNSNVYVFSHPDSGFINLYCESAVEEDKAENFAALFIPEEAAKVKDWVKQDAVLASKVEYMKKFLAATDPVMNEEYWSKIQK